MKHQQKTPSFLRVSRTVVLLAIVAAITTLSVVPEVTKPLFVKYYRAMYKAEAVKTL